jgi:electron transfer flavoprotein beta subunit
MRIMAILGRILDPAGIVVNRRAGRVFVNREEYVIQPADHCALEAGLRIKDAVGAEVVGVPRGLIPDDDVLRYALASGADRAVYLTGDGIEGIGDAGWARVLAAAAEQLGWVDLVLAGATTLDTGQSQLGPRVAEALGWAQIVNAWQVAVTDGRVQVVRRDDGVYSLFETDLPAVVTVRAGALKPRYPDGVRLINVYKHVGDIAANLEQWDVADLMGVEAVTPLAETLVEIRGQSFPPERERGVRATGSPEEVARTAALALRQMVRG